MAAVQVEKRRQTARKARAAARALVVARDCIAKKFGATWRAVVVTSLNQMTIHAGPFIFP